MERYEVDELLKLTPEEELKISETKKISKTKMDIYYKLGWHMVYISILSIICSYLFSYLFLIITTISLVVFLIANKKVFYSILLVIFVCLVFSFKFVKYLVNTFKNIIITYITDNINGNFAKELLGEENVC